MIAEIARFDEKQLQAYRDSEKNYMDFSASLQTSFREGKEERESEIAKNLIRLGGDNEFISKATGLTPAQIDKLREES